MQFAYLHLVQHPHQYVGFGVNTRANASVNTSHQASGHNIPLML